MAQEPQEKETTTAGLWQAHKKEIIAGMAGALVLIVLGAVLFRSFVHKEKPVEIPPENMIGSINLRQAMEAHKDYEHLVELRGEERRLQEEVRTLLMPPMVVNPPKVDSEPFDDAVWQKNAQNIIGQAAEIEREQKKAVAAIKEATEAEFTQRRDEINELYLNEILNIQLKLQNADVLHLSEENIAALEERMAAIQQERGERQRALYDEWQKEITSKAEAQVADKKTQLMNEAKTSREQLEAESIRKQTEAQARNAATMNQAMELSMKRQAAVETQQQLIAVMAEAEALEGQIMNDIAGKAAKIAIMHHYTMIIASPSLTLKHLIPWNWVGAEPEKYSAPVGSGLNDLTEELITEVEAIK